MREQAYLHDVFFEVLAKAREAAAQVRYSTSGEDHEIAQARAIAYYEVLSTMLNRLDAFGIPRSDVGIPEDLDAQKELL
jgi:hypothetical protein